MLNILYTLIINSFFVLVKNGYLSVVLIMLCNLLLYVLYKFKFKPKTYKITNFYVTYFFVSIYIGFFIIYILLLRALRIGNIVDLKIIYKMLLKLYETAYISYPILAALLIMFCLLWLIIVFRIRPFLVTEIKKLHLYLYNTSYLFHLQNKVPQVTVYKQIIKQFIHRYSFNLCMNYFKYLIILCITKLCLYFCPKYKKTILDLLFKYFLGGTKMYTFFRYFMFGIMLFLFAYDCYFNDFVIKHVFYYLPIYILFLLWYNISFFLYNTFFEFDWILFEQYYCQPLVIYVNLTSEQEKELNSYITLGLQKYSVKENLNTLFVKLSNPFLHMHPILQNCRFIRVENNPNFIDSIGTVIYVNEMQNKCFDLTELKIIDGKYFVEDTL